MDEITSTNGVMQVNLSPTMTPQEWAERHAFLVSVRRKARQLIVESMDFGIDRYGSQFAEGVHTQAELALGLPEPKEKFGINGEGKAKGLVSIEGAAQGFKLWYRTVEHLIPKWGPEKLDMAIELLEEPVAAHARLVEMRARAGRE